jgi:hypothetical protein
MRFGRRSVLVGVGIVLAVLVGAFAIVLDGSSSETSDSAAVAPARPMPAIGESSGAQEKGGAGSDARASDGAPGVPVGGVQRDLVRTAQLTVEVPEPVAAVRQVRTATTVAGGFVTEEQSGDSGSRMVLRVPADALDRLIDEIAGYGRVTQRHSQVVDATEQLVDLDSRVASQTASVARVRTLLSEAADLGDVISIESELAQREAELDSLTRRLAALRDQVALSTLTLDLRGPAAVPPPPAEEPAPGFLDGLAAGWAGLRAIGAAAATVVGFLLPFAPVLGAAVALWWAGRRMLRVRRMPAPVGVGGRSGPGSEGES